MPFCLGYGLGLTLADIARLIMAGATLTGGLYSARPAIPAIGDMYFSTDRGSYGALSLCIVAGVWVEEPATSRGTGTFAALPVAPIAGDTYAVTSGPQVGARYVCFVNGSWESDMAAPVPVPFDLSGDATWVTVVAPAYAGSVVIAGGALTATVVAGPAQPPHYYADTTHAWPLNYGAFRLKARMQVVSGEAVSSAGTRAIVSYSGGGNIFAQLCSNGGLNFYIDNALQTGFASQPVDGSLWVMIESTGLVVRLYTSINASDDDSLNNWVERWSGNSAKAIPVSLVCSTFREWNASAFDTAGILRDLSVTPLQV